MPRKEITRADTLPDAEYAKVRAARRAAMVALKRGRRVAVGPDATFHFESYETMWHQVHEMLHVGRGGEARIADELRAYNPLVPKGRELVATVMFEVDQPVRRAALLAGLGGVERTISLTVDAHAIAAVAEPEPERPGAGASAIHFLHFPMTDAQAAAFKVPGARIGLAVGHPAYPHAAVLPEAVRAALAGDLD